MTKSQEVTIDFLEIDHIRQSIKDAAKLFGFKPTGRARSFYARSSFYIGRSVSVLRIYNIRDTKLTYRICDYVADQFPEYAFIDEYNAIYVYLRGTNKRRY